jgi:hypothetical protein
MRCRPHVVLLLVLVLAWMPCPAGAPQTEEMPRKDPAVVMEEYRARREKMPADNVEAALALAEWCEENGLKTQAANLCREALRLDPKNAKANEKLGNKLIKTPKGEMWLAPKEVEEFEQEQQLFEIPKDTDKLKAFVDAWEKQVPLRWKMKDETPDPNKAKSKSWYHLRVRKVLETEVSLMNRTLGTLEVDGEKVAKGKRWSKTEEDWLLASSTHGSYSARQWRGAWSLDVPFRVEGKYGFVIRLRYLLEVGDGKEDVLRTAEAAKIQKAVEVRLELDRRTEFQRESERTRRELGNPQRD